MEFIPISGYHAYDNDGNLIATVHIDSTGNFIVDNGEESLVLASNIDDADAVCTLLGKLIKEYKGQKSSSNIIKLNVVTEETTETE